MNKRLESIRDSILEDMNYAISDTEDIEGAIEYLENNALEVDNNEVLLIFGGPTAYIDLYSGELVVSLGDDKEICELDHNFIDLIVYAIEGLEI